VQTDLRTHGVIANLQKVQQGREIRTRGRRRKSGCDDGGMQYDVLHARERLPQFLEH